MCGVVCLFVSAVAVVVLLCLLVFTPEEGVSGSRGMTATQQRSGTGLPLLVGCCVCCMCISHVLSCVPTPQGLQAARSQGWREAGAGRRPCAGVCDGTQPALA